MARPLIFTFKKQNLPFLPFSTSFLVILLTVISMFSLVSFLCASHRRKKSHKKETNNSSCSSSSSSPCSSSSSNEKKLLSKLNSSISSKALLMVKMVSWKKSNHHDHDYDDNENYEDESEEAVWRKTIIMGEKCRPLDFSGKIEYDSHGNLVSESCRF